MMIQKNRIAFIVKTAWLDALKNMAKLLLFMSSIIAGVAALVAINSFNQNLSRDIDLQAASLLGADLAVTSNKTVEDSIIILLDSLQGEKAKELEIFSMAYIARSDQSAFVRLKGLDGNFPFYGKIKTKPEGSDKTYKKNHTLLVDESMMLQYDLKPGDSIKVGLKTFAIEAYLVSTFGSASISSTFAPTVYLAYEDLLSTNLIQPGSLVNYAYFYKVPSGFDINDWKEKHRSKLRAGGVRTETIEDRKENLDEAFTNLNYFLNLVALVALLLGCIGVASSVYIYVKTKINSIAVMRCLGVKKWESFAIYFLQISILGFISVVLGAILGSGIQVLLPLVLKDFLPMEVNITLSWKSFFEGIFIGSIITSLFSMIPILTIRRISPLMTLRSSVSNDNKLDLGQWILGFIIVVSLFLFMYRITSSWQDAVVFTVGLGMGFLLLYGFAALIVFLLRVILSPSWPFVFRQGISNLYRPQNQTKTLILSLGLGTMVLTTLFFIQGLLLSNVSMMDTGNQPNTILYGIESNQVQGVIDSTKNLNLPIIQNVPIVTMKLEAWNGKSKAEWLKDTISSRGNRWAMNREARVTYRDTLADKETLISGTLDRAVKQDGDSVFVSLADSYAEALNLKLGDEIVFNVQGTLITCYVGSIRRIEFNNMSTRFFIVFPSGVLEQAPQFSVLVTKTPNANVTAQYRNAIVKAFPNVSVVDLASILTAVSDILNKVSYVIKFMALFSLITGFIVLLSSLMLSKFQRIGESVLLRTIGARKKIILWINVIEYFILGFLASISGVILSMIAAFLIAKYQFQLDFHVNFLPILLIVFFITTITVVIGILNSKEVLNNPPLEVLRKEV